MFGDNLTSKGATLSQALEQTQMFSAPDFGNPFALRLDMLKNIVRCSLFLILAASLQAQMLDAVRPDSGKIGSVLRIRGNDLGKAKIDSVYLSDQTLDMMVKVLNQTDNLIEFRIPPSVKPGKFQLVLKTAGKEPRILEQPFFIKVDESGEAGEVAAGSK
jgi:hypothetical protein